MGQTASMSSASPGLPGRVMSPDTVHHHRVTQWLHSLISSRSLCSAPPLSSLSLPNPRPAFCPYSWFHCFLYCLLFCILQKAMMESHSTQPPESGFLSNLSFNIQSGISKIALCLLPAPLPQPCLHFSPDRPCRVWPLPIPVYVSV